MTHSPKQTMAKSEKVGENVAIYERNGRWYVNFQVNRRQVRRSLKTQSKKEAKRRALAIERDIVNGEHRPAKRPPLIDDVIVQYVAHLKSEGRKPKTISKYEFCYDILRDVAQRRRCTRISDIDVALVDQFRAERAAGTETVNPSKPKTVHNDTVAIRQLVNFALKRGLIEDDPLKSLKMKKPKRTPQPCWTRDQVDLILAAAKPPHHPALVFLAETGTRVGEAKWLTWDDVDLKHRQIHIRPKPGWTPKSGDQRVVPMSNRAFELLSNHPRHGTWVFTARVTPRNPEPGRQISERRLLQYLKRVLKGLGLAGHLHTFRHSFISFAAYEGISEQVLRRWIGHVDRDVLDWYFHLADSASQAAMDRLSRAAERKQKSA